jgi:hypothetical protein
MRNISFPVAIALYLFSMALPLTAQDAPTHAPDGGTRQTLISIDIPPAANAPFTATVVTEWTQTLPDGSTQTVKNHRTVARDNAGRVFQERRIFSPTGDQQETALSELDYVDPYRHEMLICNPQTQVCLVHKYNPPPVIDLSKSGPLPNGAGSVTRDDLGRHTLEGLDLVGSREVTTLNAGVAGSQKAEQTIKEFWYSPYLSINVLTQRIDPHSSAIQNFVVKNIHLDNPDSKLFDPPSDYRQIKIDEQ